MSFPGRQHPMYRIIVIGIVLILAYLLIKRFLFPPDRINDRRREERRIKGEDLVEDPNCHTFIFRSPRLSGWMSMEKRFISAVKNVTKNFGKKAGTCPADPPADQNLSLQTGNSD